MFTLEFEEAYPILLVRFSGVLMPKDIFQIDQVVVDAIAWGGPLHGLLFDFSSVQAVGIPQTFIALRASLPPIAPDCKRVFVVPTDEVRKLAQEYVTLQRGYGTKAPSVVQSVFEAYEALQVERPNF